jgi:quercetin dioxygenase-like cupin family protein
VHLKATKQQLQGAAFSPNGAFTMKSMNVETHNQSIAQTTEQPEVIVNPVTGDSMTILYSSNRSDGTYAKIRFDLPPGAKGSPLHYHTKMSETFTVLQGWVKP